MTRRFVPLVLVALALATTVFANPAPKKLPALVPPTKPYTVEFYYKVRWGQTTPESHLPEDARWDYRITIVFKDAVAAASDLDEDELVRALFPNEALHKKEEQQRFELLLAHWDVPLTELDLK